MKSSAIRVAALVGIALWLSPFLPNGELDRNHERHLQEIEKVKHDYLVQAFNWEALMDGTMTQETRFKETTQEQDGRRVQGKEESTQSSGQRVLSRVQELQSGVSRKLEDVTTVNAGPIPLRLDTRRTKVSAASVEITPSLTATLPREYELSTRAKFYFPFDSEADIGYMEFDIRKRFGEVNASASYQVLMNGLPTEHKIRAEVKIDLDRLWSR